MDNMDYISLVISVAWCTMVVCYSVLCEKFSKSLAFGQALGSYAVLFDAWVKLMCQYLYVILTTAFQNRTFFHYYSLPLIEMFM